MKNLTQKQGEEEVKHLGQVVDGEGEEKNHGSVEKEFAQTSQQASCLQTRLQDQTETREESVQPLKNPQLKINESLYVFSPRGGTK